MYNMWKIDHIKELNFFRCDNGCGYVNNSFSPLDNKLFAFQLVIYCFFHNLWLRVLFIYLLTYLFAVLGLRCCMGAFSSCSEQGLLFVAVRGLLIVVASLCCGARALGARAQ